MSVEYCVGKLNSSFYFGESERIILSPENLKSTAWNTGQKKSEKLPQSMFKTRLDTFGNDFGLLWNFEFFLIFLKIFQDSTLNGTVGKKNFPKESPKTRLDTWERFGTFLEIWNFIDFFLEFFLSIFLKI